jgi:hypothetical protein
MKKKTIINILWATLLVLVLLVASHYDYKYQQEDREIQEEMRAADAEQWFYEYHNQD